MLSSNSRGVLAAKSRFFVVAPNVAIFTFVGVAPTPQPGGSATRANMAPDTDSV